MATLLLVAGVTLFLIASGAASYVAISAVSGIGATATAVARRARLRAAWPAVGVLLGTAVVAILLITWGFDPGAAVGTTSGIAVTAMVICRSLLGQPSRRAFA